MPGPRPQPKPHGDRDAQRDAMLAAAAAILARDGVAGLNLRKLAETVGTSTMAVYSLFGGKDGLVDALYVMTMEKLGAALQAVAPDPDPVRWLADLAVAYRRFALAHPALYGIVVGQTVPHHRVATERLRVQAGFQTLKRAVITLIKREDAAGRFEPEQVAAALWSMVHGVVSLELVGQFDTATADHILAHSAEAVLARYLALMRQR